MKIKEEGNMRTGVIKAANNERFNIAVKLHFLLVPDMHHVHQAGLDELRRTITSHGTLSVSDSQVMSLRCS